MLQDFFVVGQGGKGEEEDEVQYWRDVVEERPVARFLAPSLPVPTSSHGCRTQCGHRWRGCPEQMLLPDFEILDREYSQGEQQPAGNFRSRKRCLTCTVLDHAWTIASTTWEHIKSGWKGTPDGAEEIRGCTCVTATPFFTQAGPPAGRTSDETVTIGAQISQ